MTAAIPYYQPYFAGNYQWPKPETWLDYRHPDWKANAFKWQYARDVYTAEVLDPANLGSYLIRKGTGETLAAYFERQALADYTSHFGACADALAGMLFHTEDDATREFGALGKPEDPASVIGGLYRNADGQHTGYLTVWKQLAIELTIAHWSWILVDVVAGAPRITLIEPERVVDWVEDETGLKAVKVCEQADAREGLETDADTFEQYIVFTRAGWQRYRKRKATANAAATVERVGEFVAYRFVDSSGREQLPIFRARLPLRRNIGYPLAKKNVAIFNKESERDHLLRTANFPKFVVVGDDVVFGNIQKQVEDGSFLIQDDPQSSKTHHFDAPPTASVEVATKVIDQKVEQFYKTFFREYSDTAQEKTATEIRQDVNSGVGAFLQMLRAGLNDAENETLWRLEQAVFPRLDGNWHRARVERDDNFQPLNVEEEIERLRNRYIGQTKTVPVGKETLKEVVRQIAAWDGLKLDDASLDAAVESYQLGETQDLLDKLPIPDGAKAKLAVRWLVALGVVEPKDEASLLADAERIAAQDTATRGLLAQPAGPPPAGYDEPSVPPKKKQLRLTKDPKTGEKLVVQE